MLLVQQNSKESTLKLAVDGRAFSVSAWEKAFHSYSGKPSLSFSRNPVGALPRGDFGLAPMACSEDDSLSGTFGTSEVLT